MSPAPAKAMTGAFHTRIESIRNALPPPFAAGGPGRTNRPLAALPPLPAVAQGSGPRRRHDSPGHRADETQMHFGVDSNSQGRPDRACRAAHPAAAIAKVADRESVRRAAAERTGPSRSAAAHRPGRRGRSPALEPGTRREPVLRSVRMGVCRSRRPGRAGLADGEAAHEDLGKFPVRAGSEGLRHAARCAVHREAAAPEPHSGPDARAGSPAGEREMLGEAHGAGHPLTRSTETSGSYINVVWELRGRRWPACPPPGPPAPPLPPPPGNPSCGPPDSPATD